MTPTENEMTRDEMIARLNALRARVPARRSSDLADHEPMMQRGIDKIDSLVRLAALEARVIHRGD